jgi:AraC-like DNA-binding protein
VNIYLDPVNIFRLICILQGLTTGAFLLLSPAQTGARRWLGTLMIIMSFTVLDHFFSASGIYYRHNYLYFMPLFFTWALGPVLYNYVANLFDKNAKARPVSFIPVTVQVLFYTALVFQSMETKTWFWQHIHKPYTRYIDYYGMCLSVLVYIALLFKNFKTKIKETHWVKWLLGGLFVFFSIALVDPAINFLYQPITGPKFYFVTVLLPICISWLVLVNLLYEKYSVKSKAALPKSYDQAFLHSIRKCVEEEKLYRDAELTLQSLGLRLDTTANNISKAVNEATGKSFPDYLNELRIAEVKYRLKNNDAEKFTLLSIAFDAGFNSKTTFNRVFKQHTGLSPKDYLAGVQENVL